MLVNISNDTLLDMLMERVEHWKSDQDVIRLFEQMYQNYVDCEIWHGCDFDVWQIVDNDCVNWCSVVCEGEENFDSIKKVFIEQGLGDCSCEIKHISYIEAVDDEDEPTMFLIRY